MLVQRKPMSAFLVATPEKVHGLTRSAPNFTFKKSLSGALLSRCISSVTDEALLYFSVTSNLPVGSPCSHVFSHQRSYTDRQLEIRRLVIDIAARTKKCAGLYQQCEEEAVFFSADLTSDSRQDRKTQSTHLKAIKPFNM